MRASCGSKNTESPRDRVAMQQSHSALPGHRPVLLAPTLAAPRDAIFFVPPAKGSVETRNGPLYGAAANSPPTALSAPCRPPIGHRDSVHGKPRKAANHAISRPTPLAPWRGPRGGGLGGDRCEPGMARKVIWSPRPRSNAAMPFRTPGPPCSGILAPTLAAPPEAIFFVPPAKGSA